MIDKRLMKPIAQKKQRYLQWSLQGALLAIFATAQALLLARLIDGVFMKHWTWSDLWPTVVLLALIMVARPGAQLLQDLYSKRVALEAKTAVRRQLYTTTQATSGQALLTKPSGSMSFLGVESVEQTDAYYSEFLPHLFLVALNTVIVLVAALTQDGLSALLMLLTAPLIPIFMILIGKNSEGHQQRQWLSLKMMNGHLLDVLRGIVTLRLFGKDQAQTQVVFNISESYRKKTMKLLAMTFISAFALELTATLATAVIAVSLGVRLLYGQIDFLPALTILLLAPEYFQPLRAMGLKYHASLNGKTAANALFDDYIHDHNVTVAQTEATSGPSAPVQPAQPVQTVSAPARITFDHLTLQYGKEAPILFEPISGTIEPGDAIALIGPSGIGKSSFIKALLGIMPLASGHTNLDEISKEDRMTFMAYVPQKPMLFPGTLLDNLRFGNPTLTDAEVITACQRFPIHDMIESLPRGYQTQVGTEGKSLSGGQIQLISLMRAWLRNTPYLWMDEPTSAMDVQTEKALLEALEVMRSERTLIISAHRQQILQLCNKTLQLTEVQTGKTATPLTEVTYS